MYRAPVPPTTPPRRTALLALAALALAVTACSSSPSGTATIRKPGHQDATSVCTLVPASQVESALGRSVHAPTVVNTTASTACTYEAANGDRADSVVVTFRGKVTTAAAAAEEAALSKLHGSTAPVTVQSGTGTAYTYSVDTGDGTVNSLVTLVGDTQVTVTSTASVDQMETLSEQIFTSLSAAASTTTTTTAPA